MRRGFRSWMLAGSMATFATAAVGQEPVWKNPIAASNALSAMPAPPPVAPRETKAVVATPPLQKSTTVPGPTTMTAYIPPPPVAPKSPVVPPPTGMPVSRPNTFVPPPPRPPVAPQPPARPLVTAPSRVPPVMAPPNAVQWMAPRPSIFASAMPVSERPMIPCDVPTPPTPPAPQPVQTTTNKLNTEPAVKPLATCQLCDPNALKPTPSADTILAIVRRDGGAPLRAVDEVKLRESVIGACRELACGVETQPLGDKQLKVAVTVNSARDWGMLYARFQGLAELGDYGLVVQVRVRK